MDSNDQQFYAQRANEVDAAVTSGDVTSAADLVAHVLIEEGAAGLGHLTDAIKRAKN